jgi:hypothetical protein
MGELYRQENLFVHRNSLEILPAESYNTKAGGTDEGSGEFCFSKYLFHTAKGSLTCRKISRRGADGFASPPK